MNLSRRKFLRGTGVALGLPWFESISSFGAEAVKNNTAPRRLAVCFTGNGVNPHHWGATQGPAGMEFMKSLSPLEPLKKHISVFKGLWNPTTVEGEGGHYPKMNVLCGLKVKKTTTDVEVGTTMDQLVAAQTGKFTPMPSVVLGTERPSYSTDSGFTSIYSAYISWSTPTTPAPKEIFPQQAFDQLFDDGSKRKRDKSILDLVLEDAGALKPKLSQRDKQKLDEYLTSVREIEQRVELAEKISQAETKGAGWQPTVKVPTMQRPGAGIPTSADDHLRLMFDIMVLAFQTDVTRVATFSLGGEGDAIAIPEIGITESRHQLSHHGGDAGYMEKLTMYDTFAIEQFGYFLTRLAETNDLGGKPLLGSTMALFGSGMSYGHSHGNANLPLVFAGGTDLGLKHGSHVDFNKKAAGFQGYALGADGALTTAHYQLCSRPANSDAHMSNLLLLMAQRMGVEIDQFGDSNQVIAL